MIRRFLSEKDGPSSFLFEPESYRFRQALAETNGLLAGLRYLDAVEPDSSPRAGHANEPVSYTVSEHYSGDSDGLSDNDRSDSRSEWAYQSAITVTTAPSRQGADSLEFLAHATSPPTALASQADVPSTLFDTAAPPTVPASQLDFVPPLVDAAALPTVPTSQRDVASLFDTATPPTASASQEDSVSSLLDAAAPPIVPNSQGDVASSLLDAADQLPDDLKALLASRGGAQLPLTWPALQFLRHEMRRNWKRFKRVCAESHNPILSDLRSSFSGPVQLREFGLLLFKDILMGHLPNTITEIFAFASLSYAISRLLLTRRCIKDGDVLSGLRVWRNAIGEPDQSCAFVFLATRLWPEARNQLHDTTSGAPGPDCISTIPPQALDLFGPEVERRWDDGAFGPGATLELEDLHNPGSLGSLRDQVVRLAGMTSEEFRFSDFVNLDLDTGQISSMQPEPPDTGQIPLIQPKPPDTGQIRLSPPGPSDSTSISTPSLSFRPSGSAFIDKHSASSDRGEEANTGRQPMKLQQLRDTGMFWVILVFLDDERELLLSISGQELTPESYGSGLPSHVEMQRRFEQCMHEGYFKQLQETTGREPKLLGLLSVGRRFVALGYLRKTEHVQDFLLSLSRVRITHIPGFVLRLTPSR